MKMRKFWAVDPPIIFISDCDILQLGGEGDSIPNYKIYDALEFFEEVQ